VGTPVELTHQFRCVSGLNGDVESTRGFSSSGKVTVNQTQNAWTADEPKHRQLNAPRTSRSCSSATVFRSSSANLHGWESTSSTVTGFTVMSLFMMHFLAKSVMQDMSTPYCAFTVLQKFSLPSTTTSLMGAIYRSARLGSMRPPGLSHLSLAKITELSMDSWSSAYPIHSLTITSTRSASSIVSRMSLVEDRASTMSVNISVPDDERSLVEDRASTMSVNISVPDDERSLVEDRASTMSVNISVPDDERSLVEDRASTMSVNISVPDDERSLVEDRASIKSVNISVLMMSM
ncbi:hypothetical protein DNTS_028285, partial [Danionella cerebrum]